MNAVTVQQTTQGLVRYLERQNRARPRPPAPPRLPPPAA
jgi:hypothetical protein